MDNILSGILAIIAFMVGGGISRWLDSQLWWSSWHPVAPKWVPLLGGYPIPFFKSIIAFLFVAVPMLGLVTVYQLGPDAFSALPDWAQGIVVMFAAVLGAYVRNQTSAVNRLRNQLQVVERQNGSGAAKNGAEQVAGIMQLGAKSRHG